ncbi:MAG: ATPase [Acidimicrobiales bacterium]|nr:ATPase [Acidimicrobiales bacterium]
MRWAERATPVRMSRVAIVAPTRRWRATLAAVADAGMVEPDARPGTPAGPAAERLAEARRADPGAPAAAARLARGTPDLDRLVDDGHLDLLAGEAELERVSAAAVRRGEVTAAVGWAPTAHVAAIEARLRPLGGALVELPRPRLADPPTVLRPSRAAAFRPLVDTYATVPYRDVDPTPFAAAAYVVMFGMMFGDVGDGLLLVAAALALRAGALPALARLRPVWPMVLALGLSSCAFGLLFGELFGPTGVLPVLWISPLDEPLTLLVAGIGVGAVLLGVSYVLGTVNRWREGGPALALYAPTGIAGASLFLALGLVAAGVWFGQDLLWVAGAALGAVGLGLAFVGLLAEAGPGPGGVAQAVIELFDTVLRLLSNVVSFARLAAFGLTHAALGLVVWDATTALWDGAWALLAVVVFVVGRALTFALEALVAGVQALRLEYYELFSRVFVAEGRPFRPWHVPIDRSGEAPC